MIKVRNKYILLVLSLVIAFASFPIQYLLDSIEPLSTLIFYLRAGAMAAMLLIKIVVFCTYKNMKIKSLGVLEYFCFLVAVIMFSTVINGASVSTIKSALVQVSTTLVPWLFLDMFARDERDMLFVLNVWKWFFFVLVVIDTFTILLWPDGLYKAEHYNQTWFLGYKTERLLVSFPMCMFFCYTAAKKTREIRLTECVVCALMLFGLVRTSATGAFLSMALVVVLMWIFIVKNKDNSQLSMNKMYRLVNYRVILGIYLLGSIYFIVLQRMNFFVPILNKLGKTTTLSGRTYIWEGVLYWFYRSPLIGKGYIAGPEFVDMIQTTTNHTVSGAYNAHNGLLTILLCGGAIGLLIYIKACLVAFERKENQYNNKELVLIAGFYGMLLLSTVSSSMVLSSSGMLCLYLLYFEKKRRISCYD